MNESKNSLETVTEEEYEPTFEAKDVIKLK